MLRVACFPGGVRLRGNRATCTEFRLRGNRATCTERRRSESRFNYRGVVGAASPTGEVSRDSVTVVDIAFANSHKIESPLEAC
ncbi:MULTISPECIES: hypothetical protein [unclassified Nostoc]|uniref:hypothetical protein n=1 Tax=unclassified Nostoc TaxID=2593658 RepID=UPI002AD4E25D|nr:hypothetical protein [Nostoc sp. DedQUE03]MDZ7973722.1 hypothetical protein [Nostoc sp. DedQUE03]MDZ8045625.1 hypothetical protein [Nostoc sp. DedQUE02]